MGIRNLNHKEDIVTKLLSIYFKGLIWWTIVKFWWEQTVKKIERENRQNEALFGTGDTTKQKRAQRHSHENKI